MADKAKPKKLAIVFDMDETLGYFTQIGFVIEQYENFTNKIVTIEEAMDVLDCYPNIFRPGILHTFNYLRNQKKKRPYINVLMYTNNIGPKQWAHTIRRVIEKKINYKIFDRTICAWKVGQDVYEQCRTTHSKTYEDLKKCGSLGDNDKICFFDDLDHPEMKHKNVDYNELTKYKYYYKVDKILHLFFKSKISKNIKNKGAFIKKFKYEAKTSWFQKYLNVKLKKNYDNKNILRAVRKFLKNNKFKISKKRRKKNRKNKTKKNN